MRKWMTLGGGAAVAIIIVYALAEILASNADLVRGVGAGVVVLAVAFGSFAIKRRAQSVTQSREADSFERQVATQAQARVFLDTIIVAAVAMLVSLFTTWPATTLLAAVIAVSVLDFWIRYGLALRNGDTASGETE